MSENDLAARYKKYQEEIQEWQKFLGLPQFEINRDEVETILSMSFSGLTLLGPLELSEFCFVLSQYACFLQKKNNECISFLKWASSTKKILSSKSNDWSRLIAWERKTEHRLSMVSFMSRRIELVTQSLMNLSRNKNRGG